MNDAVLSAATAVLLRNWRGRHTVPAGGLYPHQWSWDSAFIAIGLRHLSPRRAQQELDSLFSAQWADGRLPQIVFDPRRDDYSPGAKFWRSDRIPGSPPVSTAGLVQPPNHAWATLLVHQSDPSESRRRRFLDRAYPRLVAWHEYLNSRRGAPGSGLAAVVHPWESGLDNSPYWDSPLDNVDGSFGEDVPRPDLDHADATERPSNKEYGKYLYLAATYRDADCDDSAEACPFRVEDPAFNAIWARSELALAAIAEELGIAPAYDHRERSRGITLALESLWDEELGTYVARDAITGDLQKYRTVSGLVPLLLPEIGHGDELEELLRGPHFELGKSCLVPSHDLLAPTFDPSRYWRGPSWFNTAWLLAEALKTRGATVEAQTLAASMAELASRNDFPEYVDPHSGEPHGTRLFSWTAALCLDQQVQQTEGN